MDTGLSSVCIGGGDEDAIPVVSEVLASVLSTIGSSVSVLCRLKCLERVSFLIYLWRSTNSWYSSILLVGQNDRPLLSTLISFSDKMCEDKLKIFMGSFCFFLVFSG